MGKYDYSDGLSHKRQHLEFMENLFRLKTQFEAEGPGVHIVVIINRLVVDWLRNHIRKTDRALGSFLKTNLIRKNPHSMLKANEALIKV